VNDWCIAKRLRFLGGIGSHLFRCLKSAACSFLQTIDAWSVERPAAPNQFALILKAVIDLSIPNAQRIQTWCSDRTGDIKTACENTLLDRTAKNIGGLV